MPDPALIVRPITPRPSSAAPVGEVPISASLLHSVREQADAIHGLLARTSVNVIQIGLRLQFVRDRIGRARFQGWLKSEFAWSQPMASNYMRAARAFGELDCLNQFQPSALFVLARKKVPPIARREAIALARRHERITKCRAAEIVADHSADPQMTPRHADRVRRYLLKMAPTLSCADVRSLAEELLRLARETEAAGPRG